MTPHPRTRILFHVSLARNMASELSESDVPLSPAETGILRNIAAAVHTDGHADDPAYRHLSSLVNRMLDMAKDPSRHSQREARDIASGLAALEADCQADAPKPSMRSSALPTAFTEPPPSSVVPACFRNVSRHS